MSTPHIKAELGDVAKVVLMPGDPLRAKKVAEMYLEDVKQVNDVRNCLGYTGFYKGKRVSVMASGMGMGSIGIYSYELFKFYDVDTIIRIGSAGSYDKNWDIYDVCLADSVYSESSFAKAQSGVEYHVGYPSEKVNEIIKESASSLGIDLHVGRIHSADVFYFDDKTYMDAVKENDCKAVEMESFALFHNAKMTGKNAACLLTISDSLVNENAVVTTPEERQNSFTKMMEVALEAAYKLA